MSEWKTIKLSDVIQTNIATYSSNDEWEFVNYLDTGNIVTNVIASIQRIELAQGEKLPSRARRKVEIGDIIYSTVRPNQLHYGFVDNTPDNFLVSTGFAVLHPKKDKIDGKFLYYLLIQDEITEKLQAIAEQSTSAYPAIKPSDIEDLDFTIPDINEQKKISSILSAIDKKIELNTQINHNLEEQAKAILGQNCLAHKTLKVGDIVSFANGFAFKSSTYIEKGKFKVVTIKNVQDGKIDTSSADCVHEIPVKMKAECILNIGDVLLSLTGNVGRTGIVCENNLLLNQRVAKIIPHQSVLNAVCYFIFRRPEMKAALETIARGTAQANLSPVETLDIEIPFDIPPLQGIALCMKSFFEQIISNEMEIQKLAQLRDALLPKLMSGEIDVSEVEV